jgi:DNA-binding transcriptional regulator YdaS (Cro superfamily)
LIESALHEAGGVQKRAAELLRVKPTTLNEMIKRYAIQPRRKRSTNGRKRQSEEAAPAAGSRGAAPSSLVADE